MEENKNNEIIDETLEQIPVETIEESLPDLEEYSDKEKRKIKKRIIFLIVSFVLTFLIYVVSRIFYPFKNLDTSSDIQTFQVLEYIKYIMIASGIITLILIIFCVLHICKVQFKITKKVLFLTKK